MDGESLLLDGFRILSRRDNKKEVFPLFYLYFLNASDFYVLMLILFGKLDADLLSAKVEGGTDVQESASGFAVVFVFDEGEALDGTEVLAWRGVFGDIDVMQRTEGRKHRLHLDDGHVAGKVADKERLNVVGICGDRGCKSLGRNCGYDGLHRGHFAYGYLIRPAKMWLLALLEGMSISHHLDIRAAGAIDRKVIFAILHEGVVPRDAALLDRAQNGIRIDEALKSENRHCKWAY